jgi:putative tricarboxylic transport membrane protein
VNERTTPEQRPRRGVLGLRIAAVLILIFGLVVLYQAIRIAGEGGYGPQDPGFFPLIVAVGLVFFGVLFLLETTVRLDPALRESVAEEEEATHWSTVGLVIAALLIYAFVLAPLGYVVATTLFFTAVTWVLGSRHLIRNFLIGLVASAVLYYGFTQLLGVRLPGGVLDFVL